MGKLGKKLKHDHSLTNILKVFIYALVMLAPVFAIATECLYIICNKNAPSNYTGVQQDVFYNAVNNMCSKPLFSWVDTTGIYGTINLTLTGLEFGNNSPLATILAYWILITLIYVLFDIIITLFTKLTHFLQD